MNRALYGFVKDAGLWENTVRRVCAEYDVYMPSHPLESMTIRELQRAALAPTLCRSLLHRPGTSSGEIDITYGPSLKATKRSEILEIWFKKDWEHQYCLVPGGRFLITCGERSRLCVWDLGIPGRGLLDQPALLARSETGELLVRRGTELASVIVGEKVRVAVRTDGEPFE